MAREALTHAPAEPREADLADIQGMVYSGFADHPYAAYVFARLGTNPKLSRAWLASVRTRVTSAARETYQPHGRVQVALAPGGLRALGVPDLVIDDLPQEAKLGMHERTRTLGDPPASTWELGNEDTPLDVLVIIFARDEATRDQMIDRERSALETAGAHVYPAELSQDLGGREHFGFADGLSQPHLPGPHREPRNGGTAVATGEILLGYKNAYNALPHAPHWGDIDVGRNGTYLVFRKLAQDVAGFWGWLDKHARDLAPRDPAAAADLRELLAAKLVGRWRSGAPLTLTPDRDDPGFATPEMRNNFEFLPTDADGMRCPITSHVRRANPRDARGGSAQDSDDVVSRHRILRRGRSYGAPLDDAAARAGRDDGKPRGLYFISLQASIARGFEFIQQTWLSAPGFHGLHAEPDPIMGNGDGSSHATIPAQPLRLRLRNVPRVVTVRGGGYFFLPSLTALERFSAEPT
ncbi:MAG: Dyp-type peroxidase [Deltaproteobacteria bacterium]|nr:Dyp-type peroxidase [Deltaproteobacteria bacterium]